MLMILASYIKFGRINEFLEVLRVQDVKIGLKSNLKKKKSQRLGISEDEKVTVGQRKN